VVLKHPPLVVLREQVQAAASEQTDRVLCRRLRKAAALTVAGEDQLNARFSGFFGVDGPRWYVGVFSGPDLELFAEFVTDPE